VALPQERREEKSIMHWLVIVHLKRAHILYYLLVRYL